VHQKHLVAGLTGSVWPDGGVVVIALDLQLIRMAGMSPWLGGRAGNIV